MPRPAPKLQIWRFTWSHAAGVYWLPLRVCDNAETGAAWLDIFRKDEPGVTFALSAKRPALIEQSAARHAAMFQ